MIKDKIKRLIRVTESKLNKHMSGEADNDDLQEIERYKMSLFSWKNTYLTWIEENEGVKCDEDGALALPSFDEWKSKIAALKDWVLIRTENSLVEPAISDAVTRKVIDNPSVKLIYTDEDYYWKNGNKGYRMCPFFKPNYSPETLDSFCYFGEMILVKRKLLEEMLLRENNQIKEIYSRYNSDSVEIIVSCEAIYAVSLLTKDILKESDFGHIASVLNHRNVESILGRKELTEGITYSLVQEKLSTFLQDDKNIAKVLPGFAPLEKLKEHVDLDNPPKVSVVILSKDNPELLEKCIFSINDITRYPLYEVIVVDNGSNAENKEKYENLAFRTGFDYYHHPMEFNFSALCNYGVEQSDGDLILLMNDDVEVIYPEYMEKMALYAIRPEIGAVGAKLLYSDKESLQHVGVTSLGIGPSHQLQRKSDKQNLYFGRNRADYNVVAVTAACLMIKRSIYNEVGGLNEELKVAYNDVDFCMKVAERGYRNVQCNSAVLLHHESLSRGYDGDSEEKWNRLLSEKEKLYSLHPKYKGYDPYHNPNLIDNSSEYICCIKTPDLDTDWHGKLEAEASLEGETLLSATDKIKVRQKMDKCQIQRRFSPEGTDYLWITGWGYVPGADQTNYRKTVVMVNDKAAYKLTTVEVYRPDAKAVLDYEKNIELCGFLTRIPVEDIPSDEYKIGVLWEGLKNGKKKIVWDRLIKL